MGVEEWGRRSGGRGVGVEEWERAVADGDNVMV